MITGSALALRTGAVIAATVAVAVLLSVALAEAKFDRTLRDVTVSRLSVVVEEVRHKVEYGLTLGLDLVELADVQGLVERAAGLDEVLDVQVVDENAVVLFAAERAAVGHPSAIAPSAITRTPDTNAAPGVIRQRVTGDRLIVAATIRNSFGQTVGEVLLRSSLTGLRTRTAEIEDGLASVTRLLVAGTAALTLAMVFAIVWRSGRLEDAAGQDMPGRTAQWRLEHSVRDAEGELAALRRELEAS